MTIIIDSREPFDIQAIGDVVERLTFGDLVIDAGGKRLVVERKTPSGFWTDLKSGRLNDQLAGCDALVIYAPFGTMPYNRNDTEYNIQSGYITALNGVAKHHIVWHIFSYDHYNSSMHRYEKQMEAGEFNDMRLVANKAQLPTPVRILAQFPGVGVDKATYLLKNYENLEGVFGAAYERMYIENIGEKTLENIENKLKEKPFKLEKL